MKSTSPKRSCCPVACTLDLIGDKWTLLVIRDLLLGRTQFREFMAAPEKIATNILTDRLSRLVQHKLVERVPSVEFAGRDNYRLTDRGRSLEPIVSAMVQWGEQHVPGAQVRMKPRS
jgi:DNA-binding HxlR family transcriptional regulator